MAKLNRGNSHISIGQYMTQAGWPLVGRVRGVLGYDDDELWPLNANHKFWDVDLDVYDKKSPYNTEDCQSHVDYANKNCLYELMYQIVGHGVVVDHISPVISTLDNPELLMSPTHYRFDATDVPSDLVLDHLPEGGAMVKRKLTQGWQQFRGSFEPLRKSLKGLTKIFGRYKSSREIVRNDALSFVYGVGNLIEGITQIVLVPFFLVFRLLKHVGLLLRHPFTGASYSNLVVRFARDIGYSITWLIEGSLETVQGVLRIVMQLPKWLIQMPLRGLRTAASGYATFKDNDGTQALINLANQDINAQIVNKVKANGGNSFFEKEAKSLHQEFVSTHKGGYLGWEYFQKLMLNKMNLCARRLDSSSWQSFCAASGHEAVEIDFQSCVAQEADKELFTAIVSAWLQQNHIMGLEAFETLSEHGKGIFGELQEKAERARAKGQKLGEGVGFFDLTRDITVSAARDAIKLYNPNAEMVKLSR